MGLFSFTSGPSGPPQKLSADGTPVAPNRGERSRCWEARDAYFLCLDRSNILDSIKEKDAAQKACGPQGKEFEKNCATSWVQYFKKRRVYEDKLEKTKQKLKDEGASEFDPGDGPVPLPGVRKIG